jgi:uncharacterized protein
MMSMRPPQQEHGGRTSGSEMVSAAGAGAASNLAKASRLVAKADDAAVQDGFHLYLHGFIVTDDGHWTVVQQRCRSC